MIIPVNSTGRVLIVAASVAVAPFNYQNGLKYDALGRLVVNG